LKLFEKIINLFLKPAKPIETININKNYNLIVIYNLFVLQGMANKDMGFIARSAFPLFLLMILAVILVVIFPEIALWMPQQMVQNIN
jgi:TRAP-type mannitol/chloroaromatic compound transport system permease large subunit